MKSKTILILLVILLIIGIYFFVGLIYVKIHPPFEEIVVDDSEERCAWQPPENYVGYCDAEIGVYYGGNKCAMLNGCNSDIKTPFDSFEQCERACIF